MALLELDILHPGQSECFVAVIIDFI